MNFIEEFKEGQKGGNKGLPMGKGVLNLSQAINGVQKKRVYVVGAAPKCGKSTFVDYAFVINPYLYAIKNKIDIEWIYFSFEIDRVSKEFDFAVFFLYYDYGVKYVKLPTGIQRDGKNIIELSSDYLRGRILDDNQDFIPINTKVEKALKETYSKRIIPIFGEYNKNGIQVKKGFITLIKDKDNPTGLYKFLLNHASKNGKFYESTTYGNKRIASYVPTNPDKYTIVVTDHVRKLPPERNYNLKQTVDKYSDYCCEIRDMVGYSFVHIIHTNRNIVSQDRMKFAGDYLYPTSEDIKETANLSEDANYVITMFNPNDEKYRLNEHFGLKIKDNAGNPLYPNMKTLHLVDSRHCTYPQHFKTSMIGGTKNFEQLNIK